MGPQTRGGKHAGAGVSAASGATSPQFGHLLSRRPTARSACRSLRTDTPFRRLPPTKRPTLGMSGMSRPSPAPARRYDRICRPREAACRGGAWHPTNVPRLAHGRCHTLIHNCQRSQPVRLRSLAYQRRSALVCREAQEREQNRRLFAPTSGQNWTLHHSHVTMVPLRPAPRRSPAAARIAASPAGEIALEPRR